jgi:ankyrin repeat protein
LPVDVRPHAKQPLNNMTALLWAARFGSFECLSLLADFDANLNVQTVR